jgi:hypothetical protein
MPGNPTSHITVTYKLGEAEITGIYTVSEETLREAQILQQKADGSAVNAFLERKGCHLDSDSGPAYVEFRADGSTVEEYYRDGKHHREDGPACIERKADGSTDQAYFRDGKLDRHDGPARIIRRADRSTYEAYYQNGKFLKAEESGPISSMPGVTMIRPGSRPSAPAP